jgi:cytochrome b/mono/diheme cytochrome c family protein
MRQVKVWDLFVRAFHWGLVLLVLGALLSGEKDALLGVHVGIGLAVVGLVMARIAWGFVGPEQARFRAFVRTPRETMAYARSLVAGSRGRHLTHNPLGGAMVVALLGVLGGLAATGALVYAGPEFQGPLSGLLPKRGAHALKEVHEALSGALLGLVALHVVGVVASSLLEGQNLIAGMITGWKRAPDDGNGPGPVPRFASVRAASAVALGAAAVVALALLLGLPSRTSAAGPVATALLQEYDAQARRANPAFPGFSAEAGHRLYVASFTVDGQTTSCSSCHTPDPRRPGRTPAGKVVEPLAPGANPARLTDRREVEKWFTRNCKQVLGRECTAQEKGDFVTWMLGA